MKILVTGAAGFVGRHVVSLLLERGDSVRALVRSSSPDLGTGVEVLPGDLLDPTAVRKAVQGADAVVHLAARISFRPADREAVHAVNVEGTRLLLQVAADAGVRRVVVAGTALTSGVTPDARPLDEADVASSVPPGDNPYLESKLQVEAIVRDFATRGLPVLLVNPTTIYGPGDRSLNSGTLLIRIARGGLIPVPPGGCNCVDVRDVAAGTVLALDQGLPGRRYLLGGTNLRYADLFRRIARITGARPWFVPVPGMARGPAVLVARFLGSVSRNRLLTPGVVGNLFGFKYVHHDRASRELGYRPRFDLDRTLLDAWNWYRQEGLA